MEIICLESNWLTFVIVLFNLASGWFLAHVSNMEGNNYSILANGITDNIALQADVIALC